MQREGIFREMQRCAITTKSLPRSAPAKRLDAVCRVRKLSEASAYSAKAWFRVPATVAPARFSDASQRIASCGGGEIVAAAVSVWYGNTSSVCPGKPVSWPDDHMPAGALGRAEGLPQDLVASASWKPQTVRNCAWLNLRTSVREATLLSDHAPEASLNSGIDLATLDCRDCGLCRFHSEAGAPHVPTVAALLEASMPTVPVPRNASPAARRRTEVRLDGQGVERARSGLRREISPPCPA